MRYKVEYTDEQLAVRLMDMEAVKDLLARRAYLLDGNFRDQELDRLWVTKPENMETASYGANWGYYVGMGSLRKNYAGRQSALEVQRLQAYHDADPRIEMKEENLGLGYSAVHTVNTGHVVIAYDGATARGLFYDLYQQTVGQPDGSCKTIVVCGPLACDFIKEDGQWKIWHMMMFTDIACPVGGNWGRDKMYAHEGAPIPEPTVKKEFYHGYDENFVSLVEPPLPEPYDTFANTFSY